MMTTVAFISLALLSTAGGVEAFVPLTPSTRKSPLKGVSASSTASTTPASCGTSENGPAYGGLNRYCHHAVRRSLSDGPHTNAHSSRCRRLSAWNRHQSRSWGEQQSLKMSQERTGVPWGGSNVGSHFDREDEEDRDMTSSDNTFEETEDADGIFNSNKRNGNVRTHDRNGKDGSSASRWARNSYKRMPNGDSGNQIGLEDDSEDDDSDGRAPSAGVNGAIGMGSAEFVNLVNAQFEVLASMLDASQIVLYVRRENTETGALEFIPAMVYPEKARVWVMGADGIQIQEGPKELPWTENAADKLPRYPFITVRNRGDNWETPNAVENDDGGLSAPLMYASLVLGMITVWKRDRTKPADWSDRDKDVLEKIASSVAMAAVLDQKQRWTEVVQTEHLRRVLAESLHQVKNPMTALRTFGKLLLRRLPRDDTLNRELAKDIILQSDRLVDLLLPVDSVIGLLSQAVDQDKTGLASYSQMEGLAASATFQQALEAAESTGEGGSIDSGWGAGVEVESMPARSGGWEKTRVIPQGIEDAMLAGGDAPIPPIPVNSGEQDSPLDLLFVQDVIEPVTRAAQAVAQARRVAFRWRVDDDLPGVLGDDRALEEALSNVVENALKYCGMDTGRGDGRQNRPTVVLRARPSTAAEWGLDSGVVIEVVDNGPGIDSDDLPYVFDRGYRGKQPRQSRIPGTGLGLGIARDIMRSMGGDLKVSNKEEGGWGAGVSLFLPRRPRE